MLSRFRLVLLLAPAMLGVGGLFFACGGGSSDAGPETCDGGVCGEAVSPDTSQGVDVLNPVSDGGGDAATRATCEDGGFPGMLDPTFGDGGGTYVDPGPDGYGIAYDVIVQPDGRTVLAGSVRRSKENGFGLARLSATGALDTGFGDGGLAFTPLLPFLAGGGGVKAVTLTADGRILAGGTLGLTSLNWDLVIARYAPDGALDRAFGDGGVAGVTFEPGAGPFESVLGVYGLAALPTGHVVVAAQRGMNATADFVVLKLDPSGSLDTTFGANGRVTVDIGASSADHAGHSHALALQSDGKMLMVGESNGNMAAIRLEADGSLDPSFGAGGKVVLALGASSVAETVTVDGAGRIVLGGRIGDQLALVRLTSSGALDSTFGLGGVVRFGRGAVAGIWIQPDGKYLVAGSISFARFHPNGAPDLGFGAGGEADASWPAEISLGSTSLSATAGRQRATRGGGRKGAMAAARYCL